MADTRTGSAIITCQGVCVAYRGVDVLHDVNLAIPRGALPPRP